MIQPTRPLCMNESHSALGRTLASLSLRAGWSWFIIIVIIIVSRSSLASLSKLQHVGQHVQRRHTSRPATTLRVAARVHGSELAIDQCQVRERKRWYKREESEPRKGCARVGVSTGHPSGRTCKHETIAHQNSNNDPPKGRAGESSRARRTSPDDGASCWW